jgi:hypothetical protein
VKRLRREIGCAEILELSCMPMTSIVWLTQQCNSREQSDNNKEQSNRNKDVLTEYSTTSQFVCIGNETIASDVIDFE